MVAKWQLLLVGMTPDPAVSRLVGDIMMLCILIITIIASPHHHGNPIIVCVKVRSRTTEKPFIEHPRRALKDIVVDTVLFLVTARRIRGDDAFLHHCCCELN